MALRWAERPGRLELAWACVWERWEDSALLRLCRSMSFSGLGGMGGAVMMLEELVGISSSKGASMRSGGGGGLGCCCGGG